MGRQLSTGVNRLKTEILNGSGRQFHATIRLDPASDLSKGKCQSWPPVGMGFGESHIFTGGYFYLKNNLQTFTKSDVMA